MGPDPKIFDDIARMAGGAVNIMSGLQQQIREDVKTRFEEMASRFDLVPREELDDVLLQVKDLRARIEALESQLAGTKNEESPASASKAGKKSKKGK